MGLDPKEAEVDPKEGEGRGIPGRSRSHTDAPLGSNRRCSLALLRVGRRQGDAGMEGAAQPHGELSRESRTESRRRRGCALGESARWRRRSSG